MEHQKYIDDVNVQFLLVKVQKSLVLDHLESKVKCHELMRGQIHADELEELVIVLLQNL